MKDIYTFPKFDYHSPQIIRPTSIGHEIVSDEGYRWNEKRMGIRSSYYFIQYTLAGMGRITTGGETKEVGPGMGFLCHVETPYEYWFDRSLSPEWEFIWFGMVGEAGEVIFRKIQKEFGYVIHLDPKGSSISTLFDYHQKTAKNGWTDSRELSVACYDFLMILVDDLRFRGATDSVERIEEAVRYFCNRYRDQIQLSELSGRFGYSPEHFSRLFRKRTGLSPVQYLQSIRIEKAKTLLRSTSFSLDKIAQECGLQNANYLCRLFKQTCDLTPGEYRVSKVV